MRLSKERESIPSPVQKVECTKCGEHPIFCMCREYVRKEDLPNETLRCAACRKFTSRRAGARYAGNDPYCPECQKGLPEPTNLLPERERVQDVKGPGTWEGPQVDYMKELKKKLLPRK